MNLETKMRDEGKIEIQFSDCFTVKDHEAVNRIVRALSKLRSEEQIKDDL